MVSCICLNVSQDALDLSALRAELDRVAHLGLEGDEGGVRQPRGRVVRPGQQRLHLVGAAHAHDAVRGLVPGGEFKLEIQDLLMETEINIISDKSFISKSLL